MRYRKKLIVVDAVEWTGDNFQAIDDMVGTALSNYVRLTLGGSLEVESSANGRKWIAKKGDWVIRTPDDQIYLSRKELFEKTYEVHDG